MDGLEHTHSHACWPSWAWAWHS